MDRVGKRELPYREIPGVTAVEAIVNDLFEKYLGNRYLVLVSRLVLGFIFVYASIEKIAHPNDFAEIIESYRILPLAAINIVAIVLPWTELLCGLFLILGIFARSSALLVSVMLMMFIGAMLASVIRGLDISCGCFSVTTESGKIGLRRLVEDVVMLIMSAQIYAFPNSFATVEGLLRARD